jgi:hypothetical protein
MDQIREKLHRIFLNYSTCPTKGSDNYLKLQKFKVFVKEAGIAP